MMDIQKLVELASKAGESDRTSAGQITLGHLIDVLELLDPEMPCQYDTGHDFGLEPVKFNYQQPNDYRDGYHRASSKSAYPSAYRGYYSDCTFNASKEYGISTVGHVLNMATQAVGKTFDGYKGGLNTFDRSTLVWGGSTSHDSTNDSEMVVGVEVIDGVCILATKQEEY